MHDVDSSAAFRSIYSGGKQLYRSDDSNDDYFIQYHDAISDTDNNLRIAQQRTLRQQELMPIMQSVERA